MEPANEHNACVDAWIERGANGLTPDRLVRAFERAFGTLWRRARLTLGEVTLGAIVDRVLYSAAEHYPILASLTVEPSGLGCGDLEERAGALSRAELHAGIRFVLTEFLTVLGNLTAEILTPALHAALREVEVEEDEREPGRETGNGQNGEGEQG